MRTVTFPASSGQTCSSELASPLLFPVEKSLPAAHFVSSPGSRAALSWLFKLSPTTGFKHPRVFQHNRKGEQKCAEPDFFLTHCHQHAPQVSPTHPLTRQPLPWSGGENNNAWSSKPGRRGRSLPRIQVWFDEGISGGECNQVMMDQFKEPDMTKRLNNAGSESHSPGWVEMARRGD